jgi:translation initiation factor 4E
MWEDEGNKSGGKISIKLKKDYTTIIWEELILALIGGVLPKNIKEEISGIVISVRREFNILQIWFGNFQNNIITDIENCIKELLQIPDGVEIETKQFFRTNTTGFTNNNVSNINSNNNKEFTGGPNIQKRKL